MTTNTLVISDEPSAVRKGHWRNKYWSQDGWADCDPEAIKVDPCTCILSDRYASEAEAERDGHMMIEDAATPGNRWHDPDNVIVYLGPVFFPEEGSQ